MAENLLSKVKIGSTVYNLKDATARSNISTLLGTHALGALGEAAWRAVAASMGDQTVGAIADAATVKAYVDAQIGQIHNFDIIVCEAQAAKIPAGAIYRDGETVITGTMVASADTMYKIYLVKDDTTGMTGAYAEYLTIRQGTEGSYTYSWEKIGSTVVDLSNYVTKTTKIANVAINDGISVADLQNALGLKQLAYKDKADVVASYAGAKVEGVEATGTSTGEISVELDQTSTAASLTKAAYTPAGSITGSAISGGSIEVTIKDADSATAVSDVEFEAYQPAGSVSLTADNAGSFQPAGTNAASAVTYNKEDDTFVKSLKAGTVDAASFSEGAFTPASISEGFFSAGSYTEGTLTQGVLPSIDTKPSSNFATEGLKAHIASGEEIKGDVDAETLIFEAAGTSAALTDVTLKDGTLPSWNSGTYTAPSIDTTKFNGGAKAADTFSANKLPVVDGSAKAITGLSNVQAAAQVFTGSKYAPSFTGTSADVKFKGAKYLKQEINKATFTGTAATLGFSGTEVADFQVTGVNYDKATVNAAGTKFTGKSITLSVGDINVPSAKLDIEDKAA